MGFDFAIMTCPPPINRTSYFSKKSFTIENDGYDNKQIQRGAGPWISDAGRSRHHFDAALEWADPQSPLFRASCALMGL